MYKLTNINITFNNDIIRHGEIELLPNKINLIVGPSGSGKSTLLAYIGLITQDFKYNYIFDNVELDLNNNKIKSNYRKKYISFVYQDNQLLDNLTVSDNIQFSMDISNNRNLIVEDLIKYVGLNSQIITKYPRQLSGGERQRVAIACALAKLPKMIILDEPTSSLDKENSLVILELLKKISEDKCITIVIASHDSLVKDYANIIYSIKNKDIVLEKPLEEKFDDNRYIEKSNADSKNEHVKPSLLIDYIQKSSKKDSIINKLFIICSILATVVISLSNSLGHEAIKNQQKMLNSISPLELFIYNGNSNIRDYTEFNRPIILDDYESIKKINEIEIIEPIIELPSTGVGIEAAFDGYFKINDSMVSHEIVDRFSLLPIYGFELNDDMIINRLGDEGFYVTESFSKEIGLNLEVKNIMIEILIGMPKQIETIDVTMYNPATEVNKVVQENVIIYEPYKMRFRLAGILDDSVSGNLKTTFDRNIYLDSNNFFDLLNDFQHINSKDNSKNFIPSSYLIKVKNVDEIPLVIEKINRINPNIQVNSAAIDFKSMANGIDSLREFIFLIGISFYLITVLLMSLVHAIYIDRKKHEFALLQTLGLSLNEIKRIIYLEAIMKFVRLVLLSIVFSLFISLLMNIYSGLNILSVDLSAMITIIICSFIMTLPPAIISLNFVSKNSPEKVMRT